MKVTNVRVSKLISINVNYSKLENMIAVGADLDPEDSMEQAILDLNEKVKDGMDKILSGDGDFVEMFGNKK